MSWNLIKEIFPNVLKYGVNYKATNYQSMVLPHYLNSVNPENTFKAGDCGLVELHLTLNPGVNSSPLAPKALLKSLVPDQFMMNLKEFTSRMESNTNFVDLMFVFPASSFDTTIMEMYKESYESRFTEQLELELTKSE